MNATTDSNRQHYYYIKRSSIPDLTDEKKVLTEAELISMLEKKDASEKLVEYAKCFPFAEITVGYPQRTLLVYNEFVYDLVDVDPLGRYVPVSEAKLHDAYWISNFHRKKFGDPLLNPIVGETSSSPSVGAVVEDITECRRVWFRPYYSFIRKLCKKDYAKDVLEEAFKHWPLAEFVRSLPNDSPLLNQKEIVIKDQKGYIRILRDCLRDFLDEEVVRNLSLEYIKYWPLNDDNLFNILRDSRNSRDFCFAYYAIWGLNDELLKIVLKKSYGRDFFMKIYNCDGNDNLSDELQQIIAKQYFAEDFFLRYVSIRVKRYERLKQEKADIEEVFSSKKSFEERQKVLFDKYYCNYMLEKCKILSPEIQSRLFFWRQGKQIFEKCYNVGFPLCPVVVQKAREMGWI